MIAFNGQTYTRQFVVDKLRWYQEKDGDYQDYTSHITFQPATPLNASRAIELSDLYPNASPICYLVEGYVAEIQQTTGNKTTFDISDDGDEQNTLHCDHINWPDAEAFEGLNAGDNIVLLGKLASTNRTATMQGDVYQHTPTIHMPITFFDIAINGMQAIATWQSVAPYFKIRIYNKKGKVLAETISDKKTITATMPNQEEHTFYLRPMLADKIHFAGAAEIRTFTAGTSTDTESINNSTPYIIYDIMGNKLGTSENELPALQQGVYILMGKYPKKIFIP